MTTCTIDGLSVPRGDRLVLQSVTEIMRRLTGFRLIVRPTLNSVTLWSWRDLGFEVHVVPEHASRIRRNPAGTLKKDLRHASGGQDPRRQRHPDRPRE